MRGGMRWSEVEGDAFEVGVFVCETRIDFRLELGDTLFGEEPALRRIVVFPQRMALERLMAEDAAEVWMAIELHAVHVEDFALVPVVAFEDLRRGRNGFVFADAHFQSNTFVLL